MEKYNFIDLFAGAGGLSEGFIKKGFQSLAYVEVDKYACETLKTREIYHFLKKTNSLELYEKYLKQKITKEEFYELVPKKVFDKVFCDEISDETVESLFIKIKNLKEFKQKGEVDIIIGGPPCQAYSLIGRARDPESKKKDPRNHLYKQYFKFLHEFKPKMFVFENVPGILTAGKGKYFKDMKKLFSKLYYIEAKPINAVDFGVLQNRKRIIVVGWRKDLKNLSYPQLVQEKIDANVWDILTDLPHLKAGSGKTWCEYGSRPSSYLSNSGIRNENWNILTDHVARPHNEHDLKIYKKTILKWNKDSIRFKYTDLPEKQRTHKNIKSFLDRFKVVAGNLPSSHTMVAHISKDGHHYIHPDVKQLRSLTVREAARIQSFPDDYYFEGPRTAKFIQIGNAVPVLLGEKIAEGIKKQLLNINKN